MAASTRTRISSGSPFEERLGICRALRAGAHVSVSGTAPIGPDGRTIGHGDAPAQARRCLEIIRDALASLGADLRHVTRTRTLLTNIDDWEGVGRVHAEFFADHRPTNTVMQVARFIDPGWLVEFEAEAIIDD